ncbi:MAG TPA: acyltransferase domain-containing protein, partial [Burkholderiales bacterium]|nr:acyltransferase domain-containing protein [Burkholderiales bacterium]
VETRTRAEVPQVLPLSARTPASLERLKAKWLDFLADPPPGFDLANAAYTLQAGRRAFEHRCALVAQDVEQLRAALAAKSHARSVSSQAPGEAPRVVFMFPGGGAHYPGAGRDLLSQAAFARAVDECFAKLPADAPADLRAIMFERDAGDADAARMLQRPRHAIPALFILEYAIAKLWESWGVTPHAVIGHSAGEYAAACLAGSISLTDALAIVTLRGQLFEQAPAGAMLAVDLGEDELRGAMDGLPLDIAAHNAPDLCIASGTLEAIAQLERALEQRGIESRRLHIDVAAHSRLLDGVLATFRERLARMRFAAPQVGFISNVTGRWADASLIADPEYWVRHLRQPVRFADGLALLRGMPDAILVEVGPGQGLCALARQNQLGASRMLLASTAKPHEPHGDLALMLTSAGALWTRGVSLDWAALRGPGERRRVPLPTYAFDHQRHWIEPGIRTVDAAPAPPPAPTRRPALQRLPTLDEWFRVPRWSPAPLCQAAAAQGEDWLVFGTHSQLTEDVVARAAESGARVALVRPGNAFASAADGTFELDPACAADFATLVRELERQQRLPRRVIHLWALDTVPGAVHVHAAGRALAFDSLLHFARALQECDVAGAMRITVVSAGSFAVRGEPLPHAERALALGPVRVIPREMPGLGTRLVDFAQADLSAGSAAQDIVREAQTDEGPDLVAWRAGERFAQQLAPAPAETPPHQPLVREHGAYLITGGLGDIALELAHWLA